MIEKEITREKIEVITIDNKSMLEKQEVAGS